MKDDVLRSMRLAIEEFVQDFPDKADERFENLITPNEILQLIAEVEGKGIAP